MRTKTEIDNCEWFGKVPDGWHMVPLPRLFGSSKGMTVTRADLTEEGAPVVNYAQVHSKLNSKFGLLDELVKYVPEDMVPIGLRTSDMGSFIFACTSEDLAGCGDCIYNDSNRSVNPGGDTLLLSPKNGTDNKYLAYLFSTDMWRQQLRRGLVDVKVFHVNQGDLHEAYVVVPPADVQNRIVSYLDERCASIDEDIAKRREVIGKLKEYKKSLIARAVTKGLDPNAEMKDSGIKWMTTIPSHWQTANLKTLFEVTKRIAGVDGLTVLSITQNGIKPKDFSSGKGQFAETYSHYQLVRRGDFAMNHMDLLTGWVDISSYDGVTSPDYRVFVTRDATVSNPKYFLYLFQMCYLNRIFFGSANGVADKGRMRLQTTAFNNFLVPLPTVMEQKKIADFLDERCADIDEAVSRQEQLIEKLGEYRKSIIHHAVTGKIDCREA